jgi:hypothetical protein
VSACLCPFAHRKRPFAPPAIDDGKLEVVALFGVVEAALLRNPLSLSQLRGYGCKRLGQGSLVELAFRSDAELQAEGVGRSSLAAQIDGEAWSFPVAGERITLSARGTVGVLLGPVHLKNGGWPHARLGGRKSGSEKAATAEDLAEVQMAKPAAREPVAAKHPAAEKGGVAADVAAASSLRGDALAVEARLAGASGQVLFSWPLSPAKRPPRPVFE